MWITEWKHTGVDENGVIKDGGGAIEIKPMVRMSMGEGCGMSGCHCSDGYWITIGSGRHSDGTVHGLTVHFKGKREMDKFFKHHQVIGEV